MKWAKVMASRIVYKWSNHYCNYKQFKKQISNTLRLNPSSPTFVAYFIKQLNDELIKVETFYKQTAQELIQQSSRLIEIQNYGALKILQDTVNDLDEFGYINSEAFRKIVKKLDKKFKCNELPKFMEKLQNQQFYTRNKIKHCKKYNKDILELNESNMPDSDDELKDELGFFANFIPPEDKKEVKRSIVSNKLSRYSTNSFKSSQDSYINLGSSNKNLYNSLHNTSTKSLNKSLLNQEENDKSSLPSIIEDGTEKLTNHNLNKLDNNNNSPKLLENNLSALEKEKLDQIVDLKDTNTATSVYAYSHKASIQGPSEKARRRRFTLALLTMIVCGSSNDFLGKTIYQLLPGKDDGISGLKNDYWAVWMLTFGSFLICSFAILTPKARLSYHKLNKKSFSKIAVPAVMDLLVTGGRYLGLVFLPAAVVSIMKNGLQLGVFRWFRGKYLGSYQWLGLFVVVIGLVLISVQDLLDTSSDKHEKKWQSITGVILMCVVAFLGAIRNTVEEILLKNDFFESDFLVGMESIISMICVLITGVVLVFPATNTSLKDIGDGLGDAIMKYGIPICYVLFLFAIYGKDTMQMFVTQLSSSMTRKLFQQLYPLGTWGLSLIFFYTVSRRFGQQWNKFSFMMLLGFILVMCGTYCYMKPPKKKIKRKDLSAINAKYNFYKEETSAVNSQMPSLVSGRYESSDYNAISTKKYRY